MPTTKTAANDLAAPYKLSASIQQAEAEIRTNASQKTVSKRKAARRARGSTPASKAVLQTAQATLQRSGQTQAGAETPSLARRDDLKRANASPLAIRCDEWPRSFYLPGIAGFCDMTAEDLADYLCLEVCDFEGELRKIVRKKVATDEWRAAQLAELLSICEQNHNVSGWPKQFILPGLSRLASLDAPSLVNHFATVILAFTGDLDALAASWIDPTQPDDLEKAAAIYELLAICEEIAAIGGDLTEFDNIPFGELTPLKKVVTITRTELLLHMGRQKSQADQDGEGDRQ